MKFPSLLRAFKYITRAGDTPTFPEATFRFNNPSRLHAIQVGALKAPYSEHAWTYAILRAKVTSLMSVPYYIYHNTPDNENAKRVEDTHPVQRLFDSPNYHQDGYALFELMFLHLELYGEAFWVKMPNPRVQEANIQNGLLPYHPGDEVMALIPQHPKLVSHEVADGHLMGWSIKKGTTKIPVPAHQMIHFKLTNPDDPFRGLAPANVAHTEASFESRIAAFNDRLVEQGCDPGGIVSTEDTLDPKEVEALKKEWAVRHSKTNRGKNLAVLQGGLKYTQIDISAKEMEFPSARGWSRETLLAVYGVPRLAVGLEQDVNRATAGPILKHYWESSLLPRFELVNRVLWSNLFVYERKPVYGEFDLSQVEALKKDLTEKLDQGQKLLTLGWDREAINTRLDLGMPIAEDEAEGAVVSPTVDVQSTGLNGAQITGLLDILERVRLGQLTKPAAIAVISMAFPNVDPKQAAVMVNSITVEKTPQSTESSEKSRGMLIPDHGGTESEDSQEAQWVRQFNREYTDPIEAKVLRGVRLFFISVGRRTADNLREVIKEKSVTLTPEKILAALLSPKEYAKIMKSSVQSAFDQARIKALDRLSLELAGRKLPKASDKRFIEAQLNRTAQLVRVGLRDRERLRGKLLTILGQKGGASLSDIVRGIKNHVDEAYSGRALTIARTETGMLSNSIRHRGMLSVGIRKHRWSASGDNVRPSHKKVSGEIRVIGEKFSNGLIHAGQHGAPADEVVNCNCIMRAVIE